MDDRELLEAWRTGSTAAGDRLLRRHFTTVFRYFQRRAPGLAEDLTQRTFEACVAARDRSADVLSFRAYLIGIARNQLATHRRSRSGSDVVSLELPLAGEATSPSQRATSREQLKILLRALAQLPIELRAVVELVYWEGLSTREAAEALGLPPGTAKTRLWRGRERLRELLCTMDLGAAVRDTTLALVATIGQAEADDPG